MQPIIQLVNLIASPRKQIFLRSGSFMLGGALKFDKCNLQGPKSLPCSFKQILPPLNFKPSLPSQHWG